MEEGTVDTGRGKGTVDRSGEAAAGGGGADGFGQPQNEARDIMQEGASSVADGTEGEADKGRDPEYYGQQQDPGN